MLKLQGEQIYLAVMERDDCKAIYSDFEYDFNHPTEPLYIGSSIEKADEWFEEIQKLQFSKHIRLGIFLNVAPREHGTDRKIIGDVALQDIDEKNRSCSVGMGITQINLRNKGYGGEALRLMLDYGFNNWGLERITAQTLEPNISAQKLLEKSGFVLEGTERKAVYFGGRRYDRLNYAILAEEYIGATICKD